MKIWSKGSRGALAAFLALAAAAVAASPAAAVDTGPTTFDSINVYGVNGGDEGYVRQYGPMYVKAFNAQDPDGVKAVTADVSSFGYPSGYENIASLAMYGDYAPNWQRDWRVANPKAAGTYTWSVTGTDNQGNPTTYPSTAPTDCVTDPTTDGCVTVDNTAPKGTDVQTANSSGGVAGRAEQGDTVTVTFSEVINRFVADESGRNVVAHIDNSGTNDTLKVYIAGDSREDYYFGQVKLGKDYVSANRTFGKTGVPSTLVRSGSSVKLTLGTASGSVNTVSSAGTLCWTLGLFPTDRAGNPAIKTPSTNETGLADKEF